MGMFRTNLEDEQLLKWFKNLKLEARLLPLWDSWVRVQQQAPELRAWQTPAQVRVYDPDQKKILEGARTTKKVWFDKSTFERHGIQLEPKYKFLLGKGH